MTPSPLPTRPPPTPTRPSHIHPTRLFVSPHIGTSWMDQVYFILLFHVLQTPPKPHLLPLAVPSGCTGLLHNHKSADGPDLQMGMEDTFSFDKNMTLMGIGELMSVHCCCCDFQQRFCEWLETNDIFRLITLFVKFLLYANKTPKYTFTRLTFY